MTIEEFYSRLGEDYGEVIRRLNNEALIKKVLGMLWQDKTMDSLGDALQAEDYKTAFRHAHTLKGIVMNLGLGKLAQATSTLTETLRAGEPNPAISSQFEQVQLHYGQVKTALDELLASDPVTKEA